MVSNQWNNRFKKMFKNFINLLLSILVFSSYSCGSNKSIVIKYSDPEIKYSGRIDSSNTNSAEIYWSGSSIKLNFEGSSVYALMENEKKDNYYNIIIDNDSVVIFSPDTTKTYQRIASNLSKGKHSIELFRRNEWSRGKSKFYGFKIKGHPKKLPKSPTLKRTIEFYGNSISAGYGVEDYSGKDSPDSTYTNNYKSYAAITARHLNAEYQCICKGGIGVMVSWFPLTMPEKYDRLNPEDENSTWDFKNYKPDVVVVNLFQNDSWLVNRIEHPEFKSKFKTKPPSESYIIDAYSNFIKKIRQEYPKAKIITMLGNMDATRTESKWPEYIVKAVESLKDKNIYTHFIPFKESPGHPTEKEQEDIANSLIEFIEDNIEW